MILSAAHIYNKHIRNMTNDVQFLVIWKFPSAQGMQYVLLIFPGQSQLSALLSTLLFHSSSNSLLYLMQLEEPLLVSQS